MEGLVDKGHGGEIYREGRGGVRGVAVTGEYIRENHRIQAQEK
jgi:hypothetical protein